MIKTKVVMMIRRMMTMNSMTIAMMQIGAGTELILVTAASLRHVDAAILLATMSPTVVKKTRR